MTPPGTQKMVSYQYVPENAGNFHRWTTKVTVAGVGSMPYQYAEDNKGRLYQLTSPFNQTTTLNYDPDGKNIEADLPNGTQEFRTYLEPQDWLSTILLKQQNGGTLDQYTYYYTDALGSYDPTGHILREADNFGRVHAFTYNRFYELTREAHPDFGTPGTIDYAYDSNGNRTSRTLNGTVVDYYHNDNNNKLLWVNRGSNSPPTSQQTNPYMLFGYDLNGNTTRRERRYDGGILRLYDLFWDGDDNLRRTDQAGSYGFVATYNGDGLRVSKSDFWTPPHTYTWGLGGVLYDASNNTTYTPGVSQNVNGTDSFFHTDWLGSTRYLTNSTGNTVTAGPRYTAFGERSNALGLQPPSDNQFAGEWGYQTEWAASYEPGTGLQYLQQRYYDPAVGRFVSPDPISFAGGLNLYGYGDNDPVMNLDPNGLRWKEWLSLAGGILGGLAGAPEGGVGAVPGAAYGAGIGGYLGSRLDGQSIGRSVVNGVFEGGVTYVGGKLVHVGVEAIRARRAAQALRAARGLQAARQSLVGTLACVSYQRWLESLPFRPGQIIELTFGTSKGPIVLLAETAVNGKTLVLQDIIVWSESGEVFSGEVGLGRVLGGRRQILGQARDLGFDAVRFVARRITGATRDRAVDFTLPTK